MMDIRVVIRTDARIIAERTAAPPRAARFVVERCAELPALYGSCAGLRVEFGAAGGRSAGTLRWDSAGLRWDLEELRAGVVRAQRPEIRDADDRRREALEREGSTVYRLTEPGSW